MGTMEILKRLGVALDDGYLEQPAVLLIAEVRARLEQWRRDARHYRTAYTRQQQGAPMWLDPPTQIVMDRLVERPAGRVGGL